ncbi:hypothetical protein BN10_1140017 [Phycicoccus elongatus Lp2]|uniref:Uncharacterized protein n=1 Tax=Phycicoccus elongatus Lp2 TaxID=1193181 RepID=N0DZI0_9MICO|nr:hypothetical protein BN10_1140017 [Phycicoccus elongatus Lp2]
MDARPAIRGCGHVPVRAQDVLRAEPVTTTVIGTVAARAAAHPSPVASGTPQWWATVEDGPHVVGLAMRAAPWSPFPVHVAPCPNRPRPRWPTRCSPSSPPSRRSTVPARPPSRSPRDWPARPHRRSRRPCT